MIHSINALISMDLLLKYNTINGSTEHYDQRTNYTDIDVRLFIETNK